VTPLSLILEDLWAQGPKIFRDHQKGQQSGRLVPPEIGVECLHLVRVLEVLLVDDLAPRSGMHVRSSACRIEGRLGGTGSHSGLAWSAVEAGPERLECLSTLRGCLQRPPVTCSLEHHDVGTEPAADTAGSV